MTKILAWCGGVLMLGCALSAAAETFSYELYAVEGGSNRLLSQGQKVYSRADTRVVTETALLSLRVRKMLDLGNGFAVGLGDDGKGGGDGMGLWLMRVPGKEDPDLYRGFSWEWYEPAGGATFRKLQGGGTIQVQTQKVGKWDFVTRIVFVDNTVFRLQTDLSAKAGTYSHRMKIKAGSVLVFPPTADLVN